MAERESSAARQAPPSWWWNSWRPANHRGAGQGPDRGAEAFRQAGRWRNWWEAASSYFSCLLVPWFHWNFRFFILTINEKLRPYRLKGSTNTWKLCWNWWSPGFLKLVLLLLIRRWCPSLIGWSWSTSCTDGWVWLKKSSRVSPAQWSPTCSRFFFVCFFFLSKRGLVHRKCCLANIEYQHDDILHLMYKSKADVGDTCTCPIVVADLFHTCRPCVCLMEQWGDGGRFKESWEIPPQSVQLYWQRAAATQWWGEWLAAKPLGGRATASTGFKPNAEQPSLSSSSSSIFKYTRICFLDLCIFLSHPWILMSVLPPDYCC